MHEYTSNILPYDILQTGYNVKITLHLKEDIDSEKLNAAVQKASLRYPYFKKRIILKDEAYEIVDNDLPIVVYNADEGMRNHNSAAVNYHLLSVCYSGNKLYFPS